MPFKEGYLNLAHQLYNGSTTLPVPDESKYRSSVSRAYYGVFNLASEFLASRGVHIPSHNAHQAIIDAFEGSKELSWQEIGHEIRALRDRRVSADYGKKDKNWQKAAQFTLLRAKEVKRNISGLGA